MTNNVNNKQPNIIMIGSDTLRKDRVGRIRNTQSITPNIDKLVKKSISFENCFVPIARTAPSLLSFFSGLLPWRHKIRDNFSEPKDCQLDVTPLAKMLKNNGYTTAVISDWCGTDLTKFNLGFQRQDLPEDQWNLRYFIRQGPKDIRLFLSLFLQNHFGRLFLPEIFYLGGVPKGKHLIQRSKSWITQLSRQKQPFFLNIFFGTTHPPFGSEYPYYSKYADPNYWGESKFSMARLTEPEEIIRSQKEPKEAFDLDQIIDLYDGTVTNFDDQVADILASIKENKIEDNTIVIIYSDHGMEFFENETWGQGNSVFSDLSYKVPLIIYNPQWQVARKIEQNIRSVDLLPTLLDILNIKNTENYDGQSLVDLIENNIPKELDVLAETGIWFSKPPGMSEDHLHYPELLDLIDITDDGTIVLRAELKESIYNAKDKMLISGQWKLVCQPLKNGNVFSLYDRFNDPENKKDISKKYPDKFIMMKQKFLESFDFE
ncbi:MAG TPA: DUF229 domain-containing protein [Aeromonadales bacterium]|nr:DUF229 domain-containing protein [Aeromonadales bacterium]